MSKSIPNAGGLPGLSGPPDWITPPALPTDQNYRFDDGRWCGAFKQTHVSGNQYGGVYFRALHGNLAAQENLFLSFRAGFVPHADNSWDRIYFGLQNIATSDAIAFKIVVHPDLISKGKPSANAPSTPASVQIRRSPGGGAWQAPQAQPTWADNAHNGIRYWFQNAADDPMDPNYRWGVQLRIPTKLLGNVWDNDAANIATDFRMWYAIQGYAQDDMSMTDIIVVLADSRIDGLAGDPTNVGAYNSGNYPLPGVGTWEEYLLTSGPAAFGGVTMEGNWTQDVVISNALGPAVQTIVNGGQNTFIARPRNYRPPAPVNDIAIGEIAATFRIANWGSVAGDPTKVDWASGVWQYVAPNHDENHPQINQDLIHTLGAGLPPPATSPLRFGPVTMNLGANHSLHQCILCTMSAPNVPITFLQDSVFQNMNYDHASVIERQAEISIVGLKPFSVQPRDVYLALEKVNMRKNTPGVNEGQFLSDTTNRLIEKGGELAGKLRHARARLLDPDRGDFGSGPRLQALAQPLASALGVDFATKTAAPPAVNQIFTQLANWLPPLKQEQSAAKAVSNAFSKLAIWLVESGNSDQKLASFQTALNQWLSGINNDPASLHSFPGVLLAIRGFINERFKGDSNAQQLGGAIDQLLRWLESNRLPADLNSAVEALGNALKPFAGVTNNLKSGIGAFVYGAARWLVGSERLDTMVEELVAAGVNEEEMDQIFPTFRVHVYHDTGERVTDAGKTLRVVREQSSFGVYAYHEGTLEGWQTSIQGAQRIADNLYLLSVPNNGTAKVTTLIQAVENEQERIPEDPIKPRSPEAQPPGCGCLGRLLGFLGIGKKQSP